MMLWRMYMRQQEAQIEQARVEAKAEGRNEGKAEGRNEGIAEGRTEGKAEGRTEGRTEGRAEAYQLWSAWNTRRIEAEAQNLPFDEPPPPPPEAAPK